MARIGKEGNRLDDRLSDVVAGPDEYRTEYTDPSRDEWTLLVLPVLATLDRSELGRRSGLHRRSIERYISERARPRSTRKTDLTELAIRHATEALRSWRSSRAPTIPESCFSGTSRSGNRTSPHAWGVVDLSQGDNACGAGIDVAANIRPLQRAIEPDRACGSAVPQRV